MERIPRSGEIYRDLKQNLYQVIAVAEHTQTGGQLVVYQALYGAYQIYAAPLDSFVSEADQSCLERVEKEELLAGGTYPGKKPKEEIPEQKAPEKPVQQPQEPEVNPRLMQFLDTDDFEEKYHILVRMRDEIDENLLNAMAVSMDTVLPEGDLTEQYEALKNTVRTRQRYESIRLR